VGALGGARLRRPCLRLQTPSGRGVPGRTRRLYRTRVGFAVPRHLLGALFRAPSIATSMRARRTLPGPSTRVTSHVGRRRIRPTAASRRRSRRSATKEGVTTTFAPEGQQHDKVGGNPNIKRGRRRQTLHGRRGLGPAVREGLSHAGILQHPHRQRHRAVGPNLLKTAYSDHPTDCEKLTRDPDSQ